MGRGLNECTSITPCEALSSSRCVPADGLQLRGARALLQFFDNVHFVLRLSSTHRLSTTERKEVTRNDEKIVHLASPLPHPQYLP
jgi:hypothetical protein